MTSDVNLFSNELAKDIDILNVDIYKNINNGVYQAEFTTTQAAYEEAYHQVFTMLDIIEG